MNFIQKQILLLSALLSGSGVRGANFSKRKNLKSVLLLGALPPGPLTGALPLYPAGDLGGPHTPHLVGASGPQCRLLPLILLLLEIFLTTLCC